MIATIIRQKDFPTIEKNRSRFNVHNLNTPLSPQFNSVALLEPLFPLPLFALSSSLCLPCNQHPSQVSFSIRTLRSFKTQRAQNSVLVNLLSRHLFPR